MVQIRQVPEKTGPLVALARQIAALCITSPDLFLGLADAVEACKYQYTYRKLQASLSAVTAAKRDDVEQLKQLLRTYFESQDPSWDLGYRRGFLVEEIIAALGPAPLRLKTPAGSQVFRAAQLLDHKRRLVCGKKNLDVAFVAPNGRIADGLECKASLGKWLSVRQQRICPEAADKLAYMRCLARTLPALGCAFEASLAGLEFSLSQQDSAALAGAGYAFRIITRRIIRDAIRAVAS
ncbi:MAG: hypothetical protein QME79_14980 [Bacillota bacterium]|nr:hypothetical protein [Bacillota bacterium]